MKENLISDFFEYKTGSSYPPLDNEDYKPDKYTCKICGWSFTHRNGGMFGATELMIENMNYPSKLQKEHFDIHVAKGDIE